ncbi:MAG: Eco57I restriction-modification methylase domain-containing protein [Gallionella sp.]|jgi:hypothetical protein|nr:Eco57I restriction-modification methylase domain-containing protein [Gallionella sp.]MCK9354251.1 Eco57I restriction-modification methylase domain-containing protein [Gallionella sp.]
MACIPKTPSKSLSPALLKVKPGREQFEQFKTKLSELVEHIKGSPGESEEHYKNHISDFLKYAFKFPTYFINTSDRIDLVIHNGKSPTDSVGVIIEAKRPTNQAEMPALDNLNVKAMQELVLYYLRERLRIMDKNYAVKHLIITNGYEWFVFDAHVFEKAFANNSVLIKQFNDFEAGRLSGNTTDFFYKEIAKPAIEKMGDVEVTHFDLREKSSDKKLIVLFKVFSPEHLLKLPFANDSNSLNKDFYSELLHIIGLIEVKDGSKKLIQRKQEGGRNRASLLENAIAKLDALDKLRNFDKPSLYGDTTKDQLFNVGLELVITWVNRVLFLKLLEAQLISYHKGDMSYAFLNYQRIRSFDDLDNLFFAVLARKPDEREEEIKRAFTKVPYLNSSLFEPTEIERRTLNIGNLAGEIVLPLYSATVLKDTKGKRRAGGLNTLEYLFAFLDAYDFASEGSDELKDDNKALINASVLGLIFEKINGYKDGSFFTPGFITMYMCRETLRRAVVQKFNEAKSWDCKNLTDLYNKIEDRAEANTIINSLKICDPAVGSGHFLVSALNELIAIKSELGILQDSEGKRLKNYSISVTNDELIVRDEEGDEFTYNPSNPESARIQKTLFNEKQTLIENCLFGVDINPNSVKICRLRLWIELLKNAYYNNDGQLETLPNIDINIKVGNSLISRFALDADLKDALKKSKLTLADYRKAVDTYRNAASKEQKREMERVIAEIKNDFRTEILYHDPKAKKLENMRAELKLLGLPQTLLEESAKEKKERKQKQERLKLQFDKLNAEIEEIKNNKIYENAFEWRFEFPEVLNDEGAFEGFDVAVGNPPYIDSETMAKTMTEAREYYAKTYATTKGNWDLFVPFIELCHRICPSQLVSLIIPNKWLGAPYSTESRNTYKGTLIQLLDFSEVEVFAEAGVSAIVVFFDTTEKNVVIKKYSNSFETEFENEIDNIECIEPLSPITSKCFTFLQSIAQKTIKLSEHYEIHDSASTADAYLIKELVHNLENEQEAGVAKLVTTGTVQKYFSRWGESSTSYLKEKYGNPVVTRMDYKAQFPNKASVMFQPKVVVTGMRYLRGFLDIKGDEYLAGKTTRIALAKEEGYGLKVLLALINSRFLSFYLSESHKSASMGGGINISPELIGNLPIPKNISRESKEKVENWADKISLAKMANPQMDTSNLENEIDQLVYALYGLTPEEIALVEGTTAQQSPAMTGGVE